MPVAGPSTSRGRELARWTTRVTQKVKEAEPTWSKLKVKGKEKVIDLCEEVRREELERLLAKRAVIQEMIDNLLK
jgi:hypothetical protein